MSDIPKKFDLDTMNVPERNRNNLRQHFPSVFTETIGENGELVESIDFEKLKSELGIYSELFERRRERYGMDWPGKKDCLKLIQEPSRATLKPCREESVDFDETENLFIEGDNLEVLKLLQKSYYGKVKMIYIDPPYNTGKEFIYPDKYSETLETYLSYAGLIDDEGRKFSTNTPNEGRYHTKWLNMMYPRLYLAKNLLRDDGVIFISIDDNEITNLKKLCDEIFGEENHLGTVVWKNATDNNPTNIAIEHEYIHVFCKNRDALEPLWKSHVSDVKHKIIEVGNELTARYENIEELRAAYHMWFKENKPYLWPLDRYKFIDEGGVYTGSQSVHNPGKEGYRYDIIHPVTGKPCNEPLMGYRFPEETMHDLLDKGKVLFGENESKIIELKVYASEFQDKLASVFELDGRLGAYDLRSLFPECKKIFSNPKPIRLLVHLMSFLLEKDGDLILDFFSGSSATAHAVMELNRGDGGCRKFIMIQLPERIDASDSRWKDAHDFCLSQGLLPNIAEISKERIRRVIKKIDEGLKEEDQKELFDGEEKFLDLGFKVFHLDKSNFKTWDGSNTDVSEDELSAQLELHVEHIDPASSHEDILYEILLKAGFMPTEKIKRKKMEGKSVYAVSDGALLICLEDEITQELIDAVAEAESKQYICLDRGFQGNDQLKANAVQTFSRRNQGRDKAEQIVFRTV